MSHLNFLYFSTNSGKQLTIMSIIKCIFIRFRLFFLISLLFTLTNCGLHKKVSGDVPIQGEERAKRNIEQGRGLTLKNLRGGDKTTYQFSTSNPMWRASLELLDFLPLTTVDYSGGIIITDWYSDNNNFNESIKITVRFLNNEIAANNIKIIVHQKKCVQLQKCVVKELNSAIKQELAKSILKKAALFKIENQNKKK